MLVVFIHGQAASGKLTVARELASSTGMPVFHNHIGVDAALTLFDFGTPGFVALRHAVWMAAFEQAAANGRSFIFTFHPEASVPKTFVSEAEACVTSRGGDVIFVRLDCAESEIERRITSPSRSAFGKLTSLESYRTLRSEGAFEYPSLRSDLTIDTAQHAPADAARLIIGLIRDRERKAGG